MTCFDLSNVKMIIKQNIISKNVDITLSKPNQIITTWPRADITPKINHDGPELT